MRPATAQRRPPWCCPRLAFEQLEDRALMAVGLHPGDLQLGGLQGFHFDDLNANGVRDGGTFAGDSPDVVLIIDVSGSTQLPFDGTPVGNLNPGRDELANTILDAEIAAALALNRQLIEQGRGDTARVAIVTFSTGAEINIVTTPLADNDQDGLRDIEEFLSGLKAAGFTNYEDALKRAVEALTNLGSSRENGNVIFLSDGEPDSLTYDDEAATLRNRAANVRAFGVGEDTTLSDLQIIDSQAKILQSTDELLVEFSGRSGSQNFTEPGLAGAIMYLDLNHNGVLDRDAGGQPLEPTAITQVDDPNTPEVDELGQFSFAHLAPGTYELREDVPPDRIQTRPGGPGFSLTVVLDGNQPASGVEFGTTAVGAPITETPEFFFPDPLAPVPIDIPSEIDLTPQLIAPRSLVQPLNPVGTAAGFRPYVDSFRTDLGGSGGDIRPAHSFAHPGRPGARWRDMVLPSFLESRREIALVGEQIDGLLLKLADAEEPHLMAIDESDEVIREKRAPAKVVTAAYHAAEPIPTAPKKAVAQSTIVEPQGWSLMWWSMLSVPALTGSVVWAYRNKIGQRLRRLRDELMLWRVS